VIYLDAPEPVLTRRPLARGAQDGRTGDMADVTRHRLAVLDVLPGTALAVLMVMGARRESGTGFHVVLDVVVPRAFDGPVAGNDLAWAENRT
jgi:hypothetical protein